MVSRQLTVLQSRNSNKPVCLSHVIFVCMSPAKLTCYLLLRSQNAPQQRVKDDKRNNIVSRWLSQVRDNGAAPLTKLFNLNVFDSMLVCVVCMEEFRRFRLSGSWRCSFVVCLVMLPPANEF